MNTNVHNHFTANGFRLDRYPFQSEAVMEAYLIENLDILNLNFEDDIKFQGSQVPWEKLKEKGRVDILVTNSSDEIVIIELKKNILEEKDFDQLKGYLENKNFLKSKLEELDDSDKKKKLSWRGILIGEDIDIELLYKLKQKQLEIPKNCQFDIVSLKRYRNKNQVQVFVISDITTFGGKTRSNIKFMVDGGGPYSIVKTIFAIVERYVLKNSDVTKEKIIELFIKHGIEFQKNIPLLQPIDYFINNEKKKRYYGSKPVKIRNVDYLVTDWWWTIDDMDKVEKVAIDMGIPFRKLV